MNKNVAAGVVDSVREMYKEDEGAQKLFDHIARRKRDFHFTSADAISQITGYSYERSITLARDLEAIGCGTFYTGRRGHKTRIQWAYSCKQIGIAARGEAATIAAPQDAIPEEEDRTVLPESSLTITQAKELLAASLGINPDQVEITIRG
jgi:hypothetical protein